MDLQQELNRLPKDILIKLLTTDLNNKYLKEAADEYFEKCEIADKVERTQVYDDSLNTGLFYQKYTCLRKQTIYYYLLNEICEKMDDTIEYSQRTTGHYTIYYHHILLEQFNSYNLTFAISENSKTNDKTIIYLNCENQYLKIPKEEKYLKIPKKEKYLKIPKKEKYLWDYIVSLDFKIFIDGNDVGLDFSHWKNHDSD